MGLLEEARLKVRSVKRMFEKCKGKKMLARTKAVKIVLAIRMKSIVEDQKDTGCRLFSHRKNRVRGKSQIFFLNCGTDDNSNRQYRKRNWYARKNSLVLNLWFEMLVGHLECFSTIFPFTHFLIPFRFLLKCHSVRSFQISLLKNVTSPTFPSKPLSHFSL